MTRSEQHAADWDAQFEQLSAYADGGLDATSRAALEAHLPGCARCRAALADLRAVIAALAALPAPALPRSFAIPDAQPLPLDVPARTPAHRAGSSAGRAARVAQWVGGIAAAVGLTLLLGSALIHSPVGNMSTAGAPRYGAAASQAPAATAATTHTAAGVQGPQSQAQASAEPDRNATPPATATPAGGSAPSTLAGASASQPPVAPIAGATLLIAGGAAFVAGRGAERRRRRAGA